MFTKRFSNKQNTRKGGEYFKPLLHGILSWAAFEGYALMQDNYFLAVWLSYLYFSYIF